jgi:hypothetical protein
MSEEHEKRMEGFLEANAKQHAQVLSDARDRVTSVESRLETYVRYDIYKTNRESDVRAAEQLQRLMELQFKNINDKLNIILKIREEKDN